MTYNEYCSIIVGGGAFATSFDTAKKHCAAIEKMLKEIPNFLSVGEFESHLVSLVHNFIDSEDLSYSVYAYTLSEIRLRNMSKTSEISTFLVEFYSEMFDSTAADRPPIIIE